MFTSRRRREYKTTPVVIPPATRDFALTGPTLPADITFTRASVATYFDVAGALQDAAINAPRFTYDPATHEALGLLIEETRTNLVLNNAAGVTQSVTVTAVAHTLSFVGTGSVALSGAFVGNLAGIGPGFGDRRTLTFTPAAGSLTLTVTGSVQWLQVEAGAFATSIIKTAGAQATRSADIPVVTGAAFSAFWNQAQGTVQSIWASQNSANSIVWTATDGTSANIHYVRGIAPASVIGVSVVASVNSAVIQINAGRTYGSQVNDAYSYKVDEFNHAANGILGTTDLVGGVPTVDRLGVGNQNGGSQLNGTIKSFRYWNTALTPAQLQALSAGQAPSVLQSFSNSFDQEAFA